MSDSNGVTTVDPATGRAIATYAFATAAEVEAQVTAAATSFAAWRTSSWDDRRAGLIRLADGFAAEKATLAPLISTEMGKSTAEARAELDKSIAAIRTLAEVFPEWRAAREHEIAGGFSVHLRPLGAVLGIMPWNFPLWQVVRFAVPAIACGNVVLLKHAPNVWGSAEVIARVFNIIFPNGVYQDLRTDVAATEAVIEDPRVRGVSLTGSVKAGRRVGELAGRALKPCVLELGGSDAYVILDDADVDHAAEVCARSRLLNAGQSCVSAKRFVVTARNADAFTAALIGYMRKVEVAPLARADLRDHLDGQVRKSVAAGAVVALGGSIAPGPGFHYPATVLTNVRPGQPAFDDELFGPVAAVVRAPDDDAAIALANRSVYGLGGAIFSRDVAKARRLATESLECGMAFVNEMVRSEAIVPFGGVKDSGVGRELGRDGAFAFTNLKTVFVKS